MADNYHLGKAYWFLDNFIWTKPIIFLVACGLCLTPSYGRVETSERILAESAEEPLSKAPWTFHWWMLAGVIYYLVGAKGLVDNPWNFQVINPAAAALTAHAIISISGLLKRFVPFPTLLALTTLVLVTVSGLRIKYLSYGFNPYHPGMQEGYELGLALREITQPKDLVVAIAEEIGNPIGIYYSGQKGWIFPPVWSDAVWWDDIKNDDAAIQSLEMLRQKGATWFGIAAQQKNKIWQYNPKLALHIEQTCELYQENPKWRIYRLLSLNEMRESTQSEAA